jgi:hypothetical protein
MALQMPAFLGMDMNVAMHLPGPLPMSIPVAPADHDPGDQAAVGKSGCDVSCITTGCDHNHCGGGKKDPVSPTRSTPSLFSGDWPPKPGCDVSCTATGCDHHHCRHHAQRAEGGGVAMIIPGPMGESKMGAAPQSSLALNTTTEIVSGLVPGFHGEQPAAVAAPAHPAHITSLGPDAPEAIPPMLPNQQDMACKGGMACPESCMTCKVMIAE